MQEIKLENIQKHTEEMYENTLKEMRERGASEDDIKAVENAREQAVMAYKDRVAVTGDLVGDGTIDLSDGNGEISFTPLLRNMFLIHIGNVPVDYHRSLWTNHKKKELTLYLYESDTFSPFSYFMKNKKFDKLSVDFLNRSKKVIRTDEFRGLKVTKIEIDGLSYNANDPIGVYITVKFKEYAPAAC